MKEFIKSFLEFRWEYREQCIKELGHFREDDREHDLVIVKLYKIYLKELRKQAHG